MRKLLIPVAIVTLVITASCKNNASSTTAAQSDTAATAAQSSSSGSSLSPEQLGSLGAQIKKQPNDADKLLAEHGLNEQSFAAAVRKVSESPADAKRYTAAYKSAS
jgi:hypothetical protein